MQNRYSIRMQSGQHVGLFSAYAAAFNTRAQLGDGCVVEGDYSTSAISPAAWRRVLALKASWRADPELSGSLGLAEKLRQLEAAKRDD